MLSQVVKENLLVQVHSGAVTGVGVRQLMDGSLLLVSTSADDDVIVWSNDAPGDRTTPHLAQPLWRVRQLIAMPLRLQHAIAITSLPDSADW
jgi:hypothetical protein